MPPAVVRRRRSPICCLIPDFMHAALAKNGSQAQRSFATSTLLLDNTFRQVRLGFNEFNRAKFAAFRTQRQLNGLSWLGPAVGGQPNRTISTADETQIDPGKQVRVEGAPPSQANTPVIYNQPYSDEINEAYDGLGATYNLYWQVYHRDSIDNKGMHLDGTVHFGKGYDNAFWDGQRMNFGDGDGVTFYRFTVSVDIMGHELTHGVTAHESNLIYWAETGALNEHISDVFGSLVKQYSLNQTASQADWLIGQGLLMPGVKGVAIRSLKAPGTAYGYPVKDPVLGVDPQPSHMKDYKRTFQDNGGVHINSGIPNYAFYLAATAIGGNAWEKAGLIWYKACVSPLMKRTTKFQGFAKLTVMIAEQLYGFGSPEANAVAKAWYTVGIAV